jgi:hypothetical protein
MKKYSSTFILILVFFGLMFVMAGSTVAQEDKSSPSPDWAFNTTIMEACSCPMFCQCYFNTQPAAHSHSQGGVERFCRFNNAFKVNKGYYGDVNLDGVKFWRAGDNGDDFSDGKMEWGVLTFDPSVTNEQREAIQVIMGHLFPVEWNSFSVAKDAQLEWHVTQDGAEARLDGGKVAEIVLRRLGGLNDEPVVIKNVAWGAEAHNDGFTLMPNEVEAYRVGEKAFEYKGTNGFMVTVDMTSEDIK